MADALSAEDAIASFLARGTIVSGKTGKEHGLLRTNLPGRKPPRTGAAVDTFAINTADRRMWISDRDGEWHEVALVPVAGGAAPEGGPEN